MERASPPPPAPPQREDEGMRDVVLEAPSPPSPPSLYHAPSLNAQSSNGNARVNSSSSALPDSVVIQASTPGAAGRAPPLSTEWSVDGHPLCHSRLLGATGVMGKVEAYRCRPLGRGEYQQQEQTMTMTAAGTVEEFLVRLADGWQGAVTKRLVEEGIARFLATVSSEEAWAREQGGEVMARSASGGGGSSSSGTSPKRKEKSGSSSHPRRASGSGGGGGAGLASGTLERLVVPLPEEAANKSSLTLSETRRGLELVRRLAAPYFAREFSQPIKELHPEVWKEYQKVITHPMDLGTITYKLRQGRYRTVSRFFRDIELVYANCERFNLDTPSPAVLAYANHLKHHTRSLWLELMVAEGEDEDEKEDGMPSVWDREAVEEKRQERQDRLLFCQDLPLSKHDVRELREKLARVQEQVEKEDGSVGRSKM